MSPIVFIQVVLDVAPPQKFAFPLPLLLALLAFVVIVAIVFISRFKRRDK